MNICEYWKGQTLRIDVTSAHGTFDVQLQDSYGVTIEEHQNLTPYGLRMALREMGMPEQTVTRFVNKVHRTPKVRYPIS